jgi:hypothetical protein
MYALSSSLSFALLFSISEVFGTIYRGLPRGSLDINPGQEGARKIILCKLTCKLSAITSTQKNWAGKL